MPGRVGTKRVGLHQDTPRRPEGTWGRASAGNVEPRTREHRGAWRPDARDHETVAAGPPGVGVASGARTHRCPPPPGPPPPRTTTGVGTPVHFSGGRVGGGGPGGGGRGGGALSHAAAGTARRGALRKNFHAGGSRAATPPGADYYDEYGIRGKRRNSCLWVQSAISGILGPKNR